jgi:hypothetical protein
MGFRTPNTVRRSSGRRTVNYRNAKGRTVDASVVSAGTGTTLNLKLPTMMGADRYLVNVPKMTSPKQTNVWSNRT